MAGIANLVSYELNGVKESFANWISNISPTDTPFVSMTGKEKVQNKYFQWQEDALGAVSGLNGANINAYAEGSDATGTKLASTTVRHNVTQIMRKVLAVSDTADALSSYGRGRELQYQIEKATKELKRDIEWAFLNQAESQEGTGALAAGDRFGTTGIDTTLANSYVTPWPANNQNAARRFAGFLGLVAPKNKPSPEDALAVVHIDATTPGTLTEADLFKVTQGLYLAGAKVTHVFFHPSHAAFFAGLTERTVDGNRMMMFDGAVDTKVNKYVNCLVDPLGQRLCLIPNRFMPANKIYIFNPSDWTQMILREPGMQQLAKNGSYEKYMLEIELSLRHRNQFASGILDIGTATAPVAKSIAGKTVATAQAGKTVPFASLFTLGGTTPPAAGDFDYTVTGGATQGTVSAAGVLTLANTAVAPVLVVATAKTATGAVTGSPATATVQAVTKPDLSALVVQTTGVTGGTVGGTATAPTLAIAAFATPAVVTIAPNPSQADLGTLTTDVSNAADVTATVGTGANANKITLKASQTIAAPGQDVIIKSGTGSSAKSITLKVTAS